MRGKRLLLDMNHNSTGWYDMYQPERVFSTMMCCQIIWGEIIKAKAPTIRMGMSSPKQPGLRNNGLRPGMSGRLRRRTGLPPNLPLPLIVHLHFLACLYYALVKDDFRFHCHQIQSCYSRCSGTRQYQGTGVGKFHPFAELSWM